MVAAVESHRVGRKKSEHKMAGTKIWDVAYTLAKAAAELDGVSTVTWISRLVQEAAQARVDRGFAEMQQEDLSGEIEAIKAKRAERLARFGSLASKPAELPAAPPADPGPAKARRKKGGGADGG